MTPKHQKILKNHKQCKATTRLGKRCLACATLDGYCMAHYKIVRWGKL